MSRLRISIWGIGLGCLLAVAGTFCGWAATSADEASKTTTTPAAAQTPSSNNSSAKDSALGRRVFNLVLPDPAGKEIALADFKDKKLVALVLLSCQCPISNQYLP